MNENMPNEPQSRLKRHHLSPLIVPQIGNNEGLQNQAKTAPVLHDTEAVRTLRIAIEESAHQPPTRTYSLSRPRRGSEVHHQRPKLNRQKTLSGESNVSTNFFGSRLFMRTFSRNPDVVSSASSSITKEEWLRLFDRYDLENNGQVDGKIPVKDFEKVCIHRTFDLIRIHEFFDLSDFRGERSLGGKSTTGRSSSYYCQC